MKYGDKIIRMEGVIVEVHDGCVGIDLKGRLGYLKVPMRMLITDYPVKVGQEVVWNMSFVEQMGKIYEQSDDVSEASGKNACEQ